MIIKTNKQGIYFFEDGTQILCRGMNTRERDAEIRKHGKIIKFKPTKCF